ncbi:MAG: hypothetical protein ACMXYD_00860 [Candidatus Woesearchaeota archaeon]
MKRAQFALEYLFIHGFALLVLIGLLSTVFVVESRASQDARIQEAERIASHIQQEILLASSVRDGYRREIFLPASIHSHPYEIEISPTAVFVSVTDYQAVRSIPSVTANMTAGRNVITKEAGEVRIVS